MTGSDLQFWLENIWYDLTHFGQADVISLVFRLITLAVVSYLLYGVAEGILKHLSRLTSYVWRVAMTPFYVLKRWYHMRKCRQEQRQDQRKWEQTQREQAEQQRITEAELDQRRQEEREAIRKALEID